MSNEYRITGDLGFSEPGPTGLVRPGGVLRGQAFEQAIHKQRYLDVCNSHRALQQTCEELTQECANGAQALEQWRRWAHFVWCDGTQELDGDEALQTYICRTFDTLWQTAEFVIEEKANLLHEFCRLAASVALAEEKQAQRALEGLQQTCEELQAQRRALQLRSVYPTTDGYWWHVGPSGTVMRQVRMAHAQGTGLWPYDAETNESLWNIDGQWSGPIPPPIKVEQ